MQGQEVELKKGGVMFGWVYFLMRFSKLCEKFPLILKTTVSLYFLQRNEKKIQEVNKSLKVISKKKIQKYKKVQKYILSF